MKILPPENRFILPCALAALALLCACRTSTPLKPAANTGGTNVLQPLVPAPLPTTPAGQHELDREEAELRDRLKDTQATVTRGEERLTLRMPARLLFDADAPDLKKDAAAVAPLTDIGALLRKHAGTHVEVVVHTDSIGGAAANQALSQRRADALVAMLTALGVAAQRLHGTGAGAAQPIATNDTPEKRVLNRRVELVLQTGRSLG
jgi:outer membrane protein OmpA-like peptidoglycan-associated protein